MKTRPTRKSAKIAKSLITHQLIVKQKASKLPSKGKFDDKHCQPAEQTQITTKNLGTEAQFQCQPAGGIAYTKNRFGLEEEEESDVDNGCNDG